MMTNSRRILVIDDEVDVGELITVTARNLGLQCNAATNAAILPELLTPDGVCVLQGLV